MSASFNCHIVIPTYQRAQLLDRTLKSLAEATLPPSLETVTIVENAARGGVEEVCEKYQNALPVRYLFNTKAGRSRAIQFGLEEYQHGLAIIIDDDVRVSKNFICAYEKAAKENGQRHYFGGAVGIDYVTPPEKWLIKHLPPSAVGFEVEEELPKSDDQVRFLGFNMACFIEDVLSVGGLNANLGPGSFEPGIGSNPTGSEWELQARLNAYGITPVYVKDAKLWHYVLVSCCSSQWLLNRTFRNGVAAGIRSHDPNALFRHLLKQAGPGLINYVRSYLAQDAERRFVLRRGAYSLVGKLNGLSKRKRISRPE